MNGTCTCAAVAGLLSSLLIASGAARSDPLATTYAGLRFRAIGPAIAGGRVTATAGSNQDAQLYYAGGADGGVFKSTNGGASWHPVFDTQPVAAVGAIAVDPSNASVVWVGTGEANPRNDAAMGDGIFRTTDGAKSWSRVGLGGAGAISSISIDPRHTNTVVVGVLGQEFRDSSLRGIYLTRDAGAHWAHPLYLGPSSGASDLVRLQTQPDTMLAGVWQYRRQPWHMESGGPAGGIYRSTDGGATWQKLSGNGLPSGLTGRIGLAASHDTVYARIQSQEGFIWRSTDRGQHWERLPPSKFIGGRGFYFSRVFADPSRPQHVLNLEGVASVSTNGGRSFSQTILTAGYDFHHAWWSRDGRRILVGGDEGLILSHDGGAHWVQPYALPFSQVYHVGLDRSLPNYRVCIGLQDVNSWCAPSSVPNLVGVLNRDWLTVAPGDGMWSVFDPIDQNLLWSSETNTSSGQLFLTDMRINEQREVSPQAKLIFGMPASAHTFRFNWDMPVAFTADSHADVLVGGNVLFSSADRGQTWRQRSPDLTRNDRSKQQVSGGPIQLDMSTAEYYDTILYIATTKLDAAAIWVGTDDGLIELSRDSGAHWANVTPKEMPEWGRVMGMDVGHGAAGTIYAVADGHMLGDDSPHAFVSDDFGASWRSITGDLPRDVFLRCIREDPTNPQLLYVGSQRGVWVSFDRGMHWHELRLNMPATAVYDLEIQPDRNDLVVGTHGRGVWILDELSPLQSLMAAREQTTQPTLFGMRPAYLLLAVAPINTSLYSETAVPENIFVGDNAPTGAIINYYLPTAVAQAASIEIADATGHIVRHITGTAVSRRSGINRVTWNLSEDGPTAWRNSINKDLEPRDGPAVVPGPYAVSLHLGTTTIKEPLNVRQDPRDPSTMTQLRARHDFLAQLFTELSAANQMLNSIDAQRPPSAALLSIKAQLTSAPRFFQDNIGRPAGLRERLLDLISQFSTSWQAPTTPQLDEATALKTLFDELTVRYEKAR